MYCFSKKINIPSAIGLAGFGDLAAIPTTEPGVLEVNALGGDADGGWQICAVDTLYAGVLTQMREQGIANRVIAASHTHYAPALDPTKPSLGQVLPSCVGLYKEAIEKAPRSLATPDKCVLLIGEVDLPIYRRFDYPASALNAFLTRRAGLFPNEAHPVDRNVYIFVFYREAQPLFGVAYHACHPVTRHSNEKASADYVGVLRDAVRARFRLQSCLYFLGCAGDIRPNLAQKRISLLPRSRLNWRFKSAPSRDDEFEIDAKYKHAVEHAKEIVTFDVSEADFRLSERNVSVRGLGGVRICQFDIGKKVSFVFLPFEVSHRYQLEVSAAQGAQYRFIVSCAGDVHGYLPHATQLGFGGYEVDGSRPYMGLNQVISMESQDLWPPE